MKFGNEVVDEKLEIENGARRGMLWVNHIIQSTTNNSQQRQIMQYYIRYKIVLQALAQNAATAAHNACRLVVPGFIFRLHLVAHPVSHFGVSHISLARSLQINVTDGCLPPCAMCCILRHGVFAQVAQSKPGAQLHANHVKI